MTGTPPLNIPYGSAAPWPSSFCYCGMLHPFGVSHLDVQLAEMRDPLRLDALWKRHRAAVLAEMPEHDAADLAEAETAADDAQRIAELRDELEGAHYADPDRAEG